MPIHQRIFLIIVIILTLTSMAFAAEPEAPGAVPHDGVMASAGELAAVGQWAADAFGDAGLAVGAAPPVALELKRQDFSELHFRESCVDSPLRIGEQTYERGLGTHANSEIVARIPAGAIRFQASAGIDNNYNTGGREGSAVFVVSVDGVEKARTAVLRGGGAASGVTVELPAGASALTLVVETTADGPACDQADWADARFIMADGSAVYLDEGHHRPPMAPARVPFSFVYDGKSSRDFLSGWKHEAKTEERESFRLCTATWSEPSGGLKVTAEVKSYKDYPGLDWVLYFENGGTADTAIISDIRALDADLHTGATGAPVLLGHNRGDVISDASFENIDESIEANGRFAMAPQGGRSSNGAFPFFDLRFGATTIIGAIGWSGQWSADVQRVAGERLRLTAGMEHTHLLLHPGERIRSPRILLLVNRADANTSHNRFRRLMVFEYLPKRDGRAIFPPVALQCFDRYFRKDPEWATEKGQIEAAHVAASLGFNTHWFDAAWFLKGFPDGVGNWFCDPQAFPRGLKPVADACHEKGIQFLLWFEPERVAPGTQIATEHPEFVIGGGKNSSGLYHLDQPEARRWLTEHLSKCIEDFGLDCYRNDFNIDPLGFWKSCDTPEREGMTEIRYIEGLYQMWDELLARHPGLYIDNCASGGRRIDLETCSRSLPLWRSDTNCFPGNADWNPGHAIGISYYLPAHNACAWQAEPYAIRAASTAGLICQFDYRAPGFDAERARRLVQEATAMRKYWYGDLYPLTLGLNGPGHWCAFQLHRADLNEGIIMVFRRSKSPYKLFQVVAQALDKDADYKVELHQNNGEIMTRNIKGDVLMSTGVDVTLASQSESLILRYVPNTR